MQLTPLDWALWGIVIFGEWVLCIRIVLKGAVRRWPSLFLFVLVLALRDSVRVCDRVIWNSRLFSFFSFWGFSFLAEGLEVWIMVQIGLALAGVSPRSRRLIRTLVPLIALTLGTAAVAYAFYENLPNYARICYVVTHVDQGISFAWLGVLLLVLIPAEIFGIQWSHGVRGIAIGFALEVIATSSYTWLTLNSVDVLLLSRIKSVIYLASLAIWGASLNPSKEPDYSHVLPRVREYLAAFLHIFDKAVGVK